MPASGAEQAERDGRSLSSKEPAAHRSPAIVIASVIASGPCAPSSAMCDTIQRGRAAQQHAHPGGFRRWSPRWRGAYAGASRTPRSHPLAEPFLHQDLHRGDLVRRRRALQVRHRHDTQGRVVDQRCAVDRGQHRLQRRRNDVRTIEALQVTSVDRPPARCRHHRPPVARRCQTDTAVPTITVVRPGSPSAPSTGRRAAGGRRSSARRMKPGATARPSRSITLPACAGGKSPTAGYVRSPAPRRRAARRAGPSMIVPSSRRRDPLAGLVRPLVGSV